MKTRFICLLVEQTGNFPGLPAASDSFVSSLTATYDEIGHRNSTRRKRANVLLERVISYFLTLKCIISCATAKKYAVKATKLIKDIMMMMSMMIKRRETPFCTSWLSKKLILGTLCSKLILAWWECAAFIPSFQVIRVEYKPHNYTAYSLYYLIRIMTY